MSTFNDAAFRTQAMTSELQMEAGRRRNEGISMIGSAAMSASQQFIQARDMAVAQAQRQQELEMRKAESDARIQMFNQEHAINALKLQDMMALDAVTGSRLTLAQQQQQLDAGRYALEQLKKRDEQSVSEREKFNLEKEQIQGELNMRDANMVRDVNGRWKRAETEDEKAEAQRRVSGIFKQNTEHPTLSQQRIVNMLETLQEQLMYIDPRDTDQIQMIQDRMNALWEQLPATERAKGRTDVGMATGGGGGAPATEEPAAKEKPGEVDYSNGPHPGWPQEGPMAMFNNSDVQRSLAISGADAFTRWFSQQRSISPEAASEFAKAAINGEAESPDLMVWMLKYVGDGAGRPFSDDEIRKIVKMRYGGRASDWMIDRVLTDVEKEIDAMISQLPELEKRAGTR